MWNSSYWCPKNAKVIVCGLKYMDQCNAAIKALDVAVSNIVTFRKSKILLMLYLKLWLMGNFKSKNHNN